MLERGQHGFSSLVKSFSALQKLLEGGAATENFVDRIISQVEVIKMRPMNCFPDLAFERPVLHVEE